MTDHDKDAAELVRISHAWGSDIGHIQGAGGNTSVKHADGTFSVKASGYTLKQMTAQLGHVRLPTLAVREFFTHAATSGTQETADESAFRQLIASLEVQGAGRPSMECGFHAILPGRFVLHTHSALSLLLSCASDYEEQFAKLSATLAQKGLPLGWIDYCAPGVPLGHAFAAIPSQQRSATAVFFLKSHGLVVHGDTPDQVLSMYQLVDQALSDQFGCRAPSQAAFPDSAETAQRLRALVERAHSDVLMPDQAVYFPEPGRLNWPSSAQAPELDLNSSQAGMWELIQIVDFLHTETAKSSRTLNYLGTEAVGAILGLESEKHRQRILKEAAKAHLS